MRLSRAAPASGISESKEAPSRLSVSFVNNMPDGAFEQTERQFVDLLDAASGDELIEVRRYSMRGVPRGDQAAARIAAHYESMDALFVQAPDVLIVTGSNPIESRIEDEPYWAEMVETLSWANEHVPAMLLSCLSAHAALKILDGLEREQLDVKRTGVFAQYVAQDHVLTRGIDEEIVLPHSRKNTVSSGVLEAAGYRVLIQSHEVGWSVAHRGDAVSSVVLVQGHPEYEPSSLLREYRRDAGRYVRHERDELPVLPLHCVASEDWPELVRLQQLVIEDRDEGAFDAYPFEEVGARAPWSWRAAADRFYTNWLSSVVPRDVGPEGRL